MVKQTRKITEKEFKAFRYLNGLRNSGVTNMFGATPYIIRDLGLTKPEATKMLSLWMTNFREDGVYDDIDIVD